MIALNTGRDALRRFGSVGCWDGNRGILQSVVNIALPVNSAAAAAAAAANKSVKVVVPRSRLPCTAAATIVSLYKDEEILVRESRLVNNNQQTTRRVNANCFVSRYGLRFFKRTRPE